MRLNVAHNNAWYINKLYSIEQRQTIWNPTRNITQTAYRFLLKGLLPSQLVLENILIKSIGNIFGGL